MFLLAEVKVLKYTIIKLSMQSDFVTTNILSNIEAKKEATLDIVCARDMITKLSDTLNDGRNTGDSTENSCNAIESIRNIHKNNLALVFTHTAE
jgi:lipid A disaccharide synthetase